MIKRVELMFMYCVCVLGFLVRVHAWHKIWVHDDWLYVQRNKQTNNKSRSRINNNKKSSVWAKMRILILSEWRTLKWSLWTFFKVSHFESFVSFFILESLCIFVMLVCTGGWCGIEFCLPPPDAHKYIYSSVELDGIGMYWNKIEIQDEIFNQDEFDTG
jgi:hypothetical protein